MQFSELHYYSQSELTGEDDESAKSTYDFVFSRPLTPGIDLDAGKPSGSLEMEMEDPFELIARGATRSWINGALMQGVTIPPWISFSSITECELCSGHCDRYDLNFTYEENAVEDVRKELLAFSDHLLEVLKAKEIELTVEFG
jgi:hypothetical protein